VDAVRNVHREVIKVAQNLIMLERLDRRNHRYYWLNPKGAFSIFVVWIVYDNLSLLGGQMNGKVFSLAQIVIYSKD